MRILAACILVFLLMAVGGRTQTLYSLDASSIKSVVQSGYFRMGSPGAGGRRLEINSRYLTVGGVPVIPVMGELQYSRMPRERWEEEILKMKACGVTVVATYSFWNHHEEIEGEFDWSGDKDLRAFVQLCGRLGMLVYPRIGPWSHGKRVMAVPRTGSFGRNFLSTGRSIRYISNMSSGISGR